MSWRNQGGGWQGGGGGGGGGGPWGQGPGGGGGGPQPPDLEELLRKGQDRFRGLLPSGGGGLRGIALIVLILIAVWGASGFYRVDASEQGVVLRFGEWVNTTQPGLNYHLPAPIESVVLPQVTRINRIDAGYRTAGNTGRATASRDVPEESLMLTGDENIVDIDFAVFWRIGDAGKFLFNIQNPESTVKAAAESAMREVVGNTPIAAVLAEGRQQVEQGTKDLLQSILDFYQSGIVITELKLQKVDPPGAVIDAFRDVQRARADMERQRNEAESYSNDIIPRARGEAERMNQEAQAYKAEVVARSEGDAARFLAVYAEYAQAKDVTRKRIYLETMEEILAGMNKLIIDNKGGSGVVPYLPLPELKKRAGGGQ
ncbi:MAG: FtsH protease activity modulator HflK [Alphaproteobacteria bacterium]|nr:FtsH protease activity modulator HflK [Alphaproteobacteria bacterium]